MNERGEQLNSQSADSSEATARPSGRKPLRGLVLALIVAVAAIAAFIVASPAFAASPSPAPSPSSGTTTHNCPNM